MLELLEPVRQLALSYEDSEEYFPWGSRTFFRGLKGRNFLIINEQKDHLELLLKLPTGQLAEAVKLPFVERHKSMGHKGWLSVRLSSQSELAPVLGWIETSYALNKPFRAPAEALPGEPPHLLHFLEQLREVAFGYQDVEEYFPYGDRAFRSRKGRIFLYASEHEEYLYVSVRLPYGEREHALSLDFVEVPKYIGHQGWVAASVCHQTELDQVLPWVEVSYEMNQPPARKSKARKL